MIQLLKIQCTTTECRESTDTGLACIDVTFPTLARGMQTNVDDNDDATITSTTTPPILTYIRFRNNFTHSVKIRQLMTASTASNPKWSTLLDLPLMASPHHEDDAQAWHVIHVNDFISNTYYPTRLHTLRLVLSQPSGLWKQSTLEHIECFEELHVGQQLGGNDTDSRNNMNSLNNTSLSTSFGDVQNSSHNNNNKKKNQRFGTTTTESRAFRSRTMYAVESVESGFYRTPSVAVASLQNRTSALKIMIQRLHDCKRSKLGNPGSTLDFGGGSATLVKIKH